MAKPTIEELKLKDYSDRQGLDEQSEIMCLLQKILEQLEIIAKK